MITTAETFEEWKADRDGVIAEDLLRLRILIRQVEFQEHHGGVNGEVVRRRDKGLGDLQNGQRDRGPAFELLRVNGCDLLDVDFETGLAVLVFFARSDGREKGLPGVACALVDDEDRATFKGSTSMREPDDCVSVVVRVPGCHVLDRRSVDDRFADC